MHIDTTSILVIVFLAYIAWKMIIRIIKNRTIKRVKFLAEEIACAHSKFRAEHGTSAEFTAYLSPEAAKLVSLVMPGYNISAKVDTTLTGIQVYLKKIEDRTIGFKHE